MPCRPPADGATAECAWEKTFPFNLKNISLTNPIKTELRPSLPRIDFQNSGLYNVGPYVAMPGAHISGVKDELSVLNKAIVVDFVMVRGEPPK